AGGRRREGRPARAGQCLDPAAVRRTGPCVSFVRVGWRRSPPASCSAAAGRWPPRPRRARPRMSSTAAGAATASTATAGATGVTGPKLAPDPMAIEAFTAFVRTTDRAMPPYMEAILSNEDLADIHAYLQTIPKPADYKSIPLLNQ